MTQPRTVVILGGGVGGVIAARELRRRIPRPHPDVPVDQERDHLFAPSLLWLMVGQRNAASIRRPLKALERKGIDIRIGEVQHIDPTARRVTLAGGAVLDADYLVVSLAAELDPCATPGLAEAGHNFYTLRGAEAFRDGLRALRAGRIVVLTAAPASQVTGSARYRSNVSSSSRASVAPLMQSRSMRSSARAVHSSF